jgi:hypothetical protein
MEVSSPPGIQAAYGRENPAGNFPAGFGWKLFLTGFAARVLSSKGVFPMIYFLKFIVNIFN